MFFNFRRGLLCKNLFGPEQDKENFIIFDFCENFEFFGNKPKGLDPKRAKSITERLFEQRLKITFLLNKKGDEAALAYSEELKDYLFKQVEKLEEDSFLVRQHWRVVEKYRDIYRWNGLNELDVKEILDHVAPLVFEEGEDEDAKRFDNLCYNLQLDCLLKGSISENGMNETISIATSLSKRGAIPLVNAKMTLIKEVQTAQYCQEQTVNKFEHLRKELRLLIRFIEKNAGMVLYSNFDDTVLNMVSEPQYVVGGNSLELYRKRMTEYIQKNRHHITIHKLRTNQPISKTELQELERMLFEQGEIGTHDQFVKAYGEQPLGMFIRSIVGLDQDAVNAAFGKFINKPSLNAAQIRFLNLVIQYLSTNGVVEAKKLFESPFTDIANNGLLGVFSVKEANEVVELIDNVNRKAVAV